MSAEHGRRITIFAMSNFTLGVPLIGIVASWLFLGNRITGPFLIGPILVFSGAVIAAAAGRSGVGKQRGRLFRRGQAQRYNPHRPDAVGDSYQPDAAKIVVASLIKVAAE